MTRLTAVARTAMFCSLLFLTLHLGCAPTRFDRDAAGALEPPAAAEPLNNPGKVIHVLVALCDNVHQGIVPVPARLGNGDDPQSNLYWGAAFGVKTFFSRSPDWQLTAPAPAGSVPDPAILERCVFKHRSGDVFLVADAYRGAEIERSIERFLQYAAGEGAETITSLPGATLNAGGGADLVVFVGHNGLMDFNLARHPESALGQKMQRTPHAMVLCCASRAYFADPLRATGATPLLWTNGLMAPEAYVLKAAIDGWINSENGESIRRRAARAYQQYQRCSLKAATNLFASGW